MPIGHTPGPLTVEMPKKWPWEIKIKDADGNTIFTHHLASFSTSDETLQDAMSGACWDSQSERDVAARSNSRAVANAYLHAAAHDLLAALEEISDIARIEFPDVHGQWRRAMLDAALIAKSAINKATGR